MLLNDFYTITKQEHHPGAVKATISIDKNHKIFEGHFPGHPIVPGVCMMQIIREVMQEMTGKSLNIANADMIKFLTIINPVENSEVDLRVDYTEENNAFQLNATLFSGTTVFFKFRSTLQSA